MTKPKPEKLQKPDSFRKRLFKQLKNRVIQQRILMFMLMLLFGFILMNHIQSVRDETKTNDLVERFKQRQKNLDKYMVDYDTLVAENAELLKKKEAVIAELAVKSGNEELLAELQKIRTLAGFTEVKGPGITLTLDDKPDYNNLIDSSDSLVHDGDIIHALDLLKSNGAGAIAINGMRITNSSFIQCNAATIICNQQRLTPPFVITARGDPAVLAEAIRSDQKFNIRQAPGIDLVVNVTEEIEIVIPAFAEEDDIGKYIDLLEVVTK